MSQRQLRSAVAIAAAAAAAVSIAGPSSATATKTAAVAKTSSALDQGPSSHERPGYYDARQLGASNGTTTTSHFSLQSSAAKTAALKSAFGPDAMFSIDPLTGTVSDLGKLDGYLSGPSSAAARTVALSFVRQHLSDLGLTAADMSTFRLRDDYVDNIGIHHLSFEQVARGIKVFGNGLKINVTRDGQVLSVQGSPVRGLTKMAGTTTATPKLDAASARATAAKNVGGTAAAAITRVARTSGGMATRWSNGDQADLVWFLTSSGLHLGWDTYTQAGGTLDYSHVVDAKTGNVLFRRDLVDFAHGDAHVYDYYPGSRVGGHGKVVNFIKDGWVGRKAQWLSGSAVKAWADVNDNNLPDRNEKTPVPGLKHRSQFPLTHIHSNPLCSRVHVCTWNPNKAFSWRLNEKADVTNAFYLANTFHDYLAKPPISFTPRAGNFETRNGDPVLLNALDGANSNHGLPDGNHIDNANMSTPPDGISPTMQMYLWHTPGAPNSADSFLPTSGAFDSSVLYHEFTHGLSNRLVIDATGNSTLNSLQAGAMGEAWSDYYAMDYLVSHGFVHDTAKRDGQVKEGIGVSAGALFRTEAMDCPVHSKARVCQGPVNGKKGGYTYGDVPTIGGSPEVHSSGEVWSQTLWDLRMKFGHRKADLLITRAMSLAPSDPDMLDMRNSILQADLVAFNGKDQPAIWRIFAHRGMGWFAGSINAGDTQPAQDFHTPPPSFRRGTLFGLVTDPTSGAPVPGATVTITGHGRGFTTGYSATTNSNGAYQINNVLSGTYQKVVATAPGFEIVTRAVRVLRPANSTVTRRDFKIRRDWAAQSGKAKVTAFNGPDYSPFGCGPDGAIDLSQGTGWGSTTGDDQGDPTNTPIPKHIVIQLPRAIDISTTGNAFSVDPSATCGDAGSSTLSQYNIYASADGSSWTKVVDGTGSNRFGLAARAHYNGVQATTPFVGARYIKMEMVDPQVFDNAIYGPGTRCPNGAFTGCSFMDMTEIEVFGQPTP